MLVRFGFVAMALNLQNASPSKTITLTTFNKIQDTNAAKQRVVGLAKENLAHTLRILKYAFYEDIHVYRFSSKLIPLYGHEVTSSLDFMALLAEPFADIGQYVKEHQMRVSFHPDHFTVLNSPKVDIFDRSVADLNRHVDMLEAMGLDERSKLNIHVGGGYGDKASAIERLIDNWTRVPKRIRDRVIFENDDKTYTAADTLRICHELSVPMTLDVHHHNCNHEEGVNLATILGGIFSTWLDTGLQPIVHFSSPKSEKEFRAHADAIDADALCSFLDIAREHNTDIDVMIEAKLKDQALKQLMRDLRNRPHVEVLDGGTIRYRP
ncbi:UV DNA damage repair endonuclease UvsE [Alicyclobacillus dauci]|uniref:UV DNA damage repair endonuclease UvsE n=1 Tax=Alicyclobacillus dauci TaxID=1475485 RepID=A0ABY6Z0W2_9BACL|nr:UV DNA damage repair endonuclease UvsE [Alicyclobacillus dauci]WAH36006.1 UV DNA damage repair endonuclease UvsE [Alicyclobacillus dauci]